MRNILFWLVFIPVVILTPILWQISSISTTPVWVGEFINSNLVLLRVFFSVILASLLIHSALGKNKI